MKVKVAVTKATKLDNTSETTVAACRFNIQRLHEPICLIVDLVFTHMCFQIPVILSCGLRL